MGSDLGWHPAGHPVFMEHLTGILYLSFVPLRAQNDFVDGMSTRATIRNGRHILSENYISFLRLVYHVPLKMDSSSSACQKRCYISQHPEKPKHSKIRRGRKSAHGNCEREPSHNSIILHFLSVSNFETHLPRTREAKALHPSKTTQTNSKGPTNIQPYLRCTHYPPNTNNSLTSTKPPNANG